MHRRQLPRDAALRVVTALFCAPLLAGDGGGAAPASEAPAGEPLELFGAPCVRRDVRANTYTTSAQEAAALALDPAGRALLVWQGKRQEEDGSYGIYAQRFDARGERLGGEVHVNLTSRGMQTRPAVALDPAGGAWIAWESFAQDGELGGIVARRFEPDLARGTNELLANEERSGHQGEPSLAVDGRGRAVIAWTSPGADGRSRVVLVRRLDHDGSPLGPPIAAGGPHAGRDNLPNVACEEGGGFALVWARTDARGRPAGIFGRRFSAEGRALGAEVELSVRDGALHIEPALASNAKGELLVGWMSSRGEDYVPSLRLLRPVAADSRDAAAWSLSPVRTVATGTPGYTSGLDVALRDDGRALVAWSSFGEEQKKAGLFARELERDLSFASDVVHLPAVREGDQRLEAATGAGRLALDRDGRIACAWSGNSGQGDEKAANLTLWIPASLDLEALAARSAEQSLPAEFESAIDAGEGAAPHDPPFFEAPPSADRDAFADPESLSGPDYGFMGITQTSLTPPDPHLAVGPSHVVLITNGRISFFTRAGAQTFTSPTDGGGGFWSSVGANGFIFDPEVLYDPHTNRFMAMLCERGGDGNPYYLFAVSDDSNPNGTWFKYRFNVLAEVGGDTDIDSPNMAVDSQAVYLTSDFFGPDKYLIYIVEKAPLLTGGVPITRSLLITGQQSIGIPVTYGTAPAQYMIEAFESFSNTAVRFHAITDPLGTPARTTIDVTVPLYQQPENPPQMGTTTRPETFESRFWSCVYRNGSLWATHHTGSTRVLQRWYQFDMQNWPASGTPTLVQSGDIDPGATVRTFFGSIWADDSGNAGLVFARSSSTEFISMARTFRTPGDPLGTMTSSQIMKTSTGPDTSGRWGDYSGTVSDPSAPGAFWGYHEYRTAGWTTWVGLMGPCETPSTYCTAKVTSQGLTPAIGWTGEPSLGLNNLHVTMVNGIPNKSVIMFYGDTPGAVPFQGGTKCVLAPTKRTPLTTFDGAGSIDLPVNVTLANLGLERFFQFYFRDSAHPDGTAVGLSDGLQVRFCP